MKKTLSILLIVCLLPLCALAQQPVVIVASFYPVYILVQNVLEGVDGVELKALSAPQTGCLHDYQLLPGDMRSLSQADALLVCGAGMEPYLSMLETQFAALPVITCANGITLICEEEHDHDHDHEEEDEEFNAHIWLDVKNAIHMVQNLQDGLCVLLPDAALQISSNAEAYIARLTLLDEEIAKALLPFEGREIVTFHEAFPYFADAYGLHIAAVIALEPDDPLSPRMLADVITTVREAGCPPLFCEPQYSDRAAQVVAKETGAALYALDPLVTGEGGLIAYEDGMRANVAVLLEAFSR